MERAAASQTSLTLSWLFCWAENPVGFSGLTVAATGVELTLTEAALVPSPTDRIAKV